MNRKSVLTTQFIDNDLTAEDLINMIVNLEFDLKQVKDAYEDRIGDIECYEKEVIEVVNIFEDIKSTETWSEWGELKLNERIKHFLKGQEIVH